MDIQTEVKFNYDKSTKKLTIRLYDKQDIIIEDIDPLESSKKLNEIAIKLQEKATNAQRQLNEFIDVHLSE